MESTTPERSTDTLVCHGAKGSLPDGLMTQTAARAEATRLRNEGYAAIATTYPYACWGGQEQGWTVLVYPNIAVLRRDLSLDL